MPKKPTHAHSFLAGTDTTRAPLVLLHGSDGTESDLMPLADELAPGATKLGIRGTVAMDGWYAFFHRFPDRRVDEADIAARVPVLAEFIETSCAGYNLTRRPMAIGFSNGAIMAAALLMTHPGLLAGAILFRPLSPFTQDPPYRLDSTPVLIIDGAKDSRRSSGDGLRLAERLRHAGALVTHHLLPVGHSITAEDGEIAHEWLRALEL
jgi:phospholipase/carboxylesterase